MGICDYFVDWTNEPNSERTTDLQDTIEEILDSWGFDPPNWDDQVPPDLEEEGLQAGYTSDDDTIHLDPDIFFGDAAEAFNLALHEAMHYMMDQLGFTDPDIMQELEAALAGGSVADELYNSCAELIESGQAPDMPDYPWQSPDPGSFTSNLPER